MLGPHVFNPAVNGGFLNGQILTCGISLLILAE